MDTQATTWEHTLTARLPLLGLLAIQMFIGYEWLISGLTKIVRGGFPAGLAEEVEQKSPGAPGWYASFLESTVIPNAQSFGYLIITGEVLLGLGLIATALIWAFKTDSTPRPLWAGTLGVIVVAALGGVFLNINLHLMNGSAHPWILPGSGFDEGVDLDSLMPAIQLAIAGVAGAMLWQMRTTPADEQPQASRG